MSRRPALFLVVLMDDQAGGHRYRDNREQMATPVSRSWDSNTQGTKPGTE